MGEETGACYYLTVLKGKLKHSRKKTQAGVWLSEVKGKSLGKRESSIFSVCMYHREGCELGFTLKRTEISHTESTLLI